MARRSRIPEWESWIAKIPEEGRAAFLRRTGIPEWGFRFATIPEGGRPRPSVGSNGIGSGGVGRSPFATIRSRMSKICAICGKKPGFGNNRSHSMVATKRRFEPNLQRVRVLLDGVARRVYVCTRCLKAGKVQKAV